MLYDNSGVRRQDRLLDETRARELLAAGEYGVLSLTDTSGPYGIPVNFVWNGRSSIYIHCAPVGRKLACIDHDEEAIGTQAVRVMLKMLRKESVEHRTQIPCHLILRESAG